MAEKNTTSPGITIGLPDGVDKDKVTARATAMIALGTHPLQAEKLAIDAELAQKVRDDEYAKLMEYREPEAKGAKKTKGGAN